MTWRCARFGRAAGVRGRADARADADHGRDLAPQQPGRAARRSASPPPSGPPIAACARAAARAGCCSPARSSASASRRRWPRRCSSCRGSSPRGCGSRRAGRLRALRQLLAGGAVMAAVGLAWPLLMWLTPASSRPYISRHRRQLDLVADPRLQRSRAPVRPGRRAGRRDRRRRGGVFGGVGRSAAAAQRGARRAGRLVPRLRASSPAIALAVSTRLRRTDARTGYLIIAGAAFAVTAITFSRASGIFHPVLRGGARAVHRAARRRRLLAADARADRRPADPRRRRADRGRRDRQQRDRPRLGALADRRRDAGAAPAASSLASSQRVRTVVATAAVGVLLLAPASWAVQTLGHATSSTFPAGGPASAQTMGGGGPGGGRAAAAAACAAGRRRPGGTAPAPPAAADRRPGRRRRDVRRRHDRAHRGAGVRQGQRRRHGRDLEPVRRQPGDHPVGRERRRDRRLLRQRDDGHHRVAGRRGRVRPGPLGARLLVVERRHAATVASAPPTRWRSPPRSARRSAR